ncbi:MAG: GNAT family N-acetyltransferase [Pseudomonadota bacterium]
MSLPLHSGRIAQRLSSTDARLDTVLGLIKSCFAYMDTRVDPPSSVHALDIAALRGYCKTGEVWYLGEPPEACVILTPKHDALYLGKLSVAEACRGQGMAADCIELAVHRALSQGYGGLELQVRVELTDNIDIFKKLGFDVVGTSSHPGYERPTSVTMRRQLA